MRGDDEQSGHLFSYLSPEQRVPADHPLRAIRQMTDAALRRLSSRFALLYAQTGRPVGAAGALAARAAAAGAVLDSQRADADRAAGVQPAVSLVRRAWRWTTRCGRRRPSRRIASACSRATSRARSSRTSWRKRAAGACCRTSTSRSMARCSRRGRGRRVSSGRTSRRDPPDDPGNPTVNFHGERRSNHDASVDDRSRQPAVQEGARATRRSWRISAKS